MTYEMNEPGPERPQTDSASHAKNASSEQVGTDNCSSDTTEEGMPQVSNGGLVPSLAKGCKRKLDLEVGRRYVLPDDKADHKGAYLLMIFSEVAEGVYTFTDERGEGEYNFRAADLRKLEAYADWDGQAGTPSEATGGTTETGLTKRSITAPTTSVTGVTEVTILAVTDYSQHTDDELHQVNLDNLAEFDRLRKKLDAHAYFKLLPALNATIARFNRQVILAL